MYNGPNRKNLRLKNYDYSQNGFYFVTICTKERESYFGEIIGGKMILNYYGKIAEDEILKTEEIRKEVKIDIFVVMPNHLHLLVVIENDCKERLQSFLTEDHTTHFFDEMGSRGLNGNHLSSIIRGLKGTITKQINSIQNNFTFGWQKSFFDVIIKNDEQLEKTRQYILNNPLKWELDVNNKKNEELVERLRKKKVC